MPALLHSTALTPQHNMGSYSLVQSSPTIFQFLQSTQPSLAKLVPGFIAAAIYDHNLADFLLK
jgi:hypothetical protein